DSRFRRDAVPTAALATDPRKLDAVRRGLARSTRDAHEPLHLRRDLRRPLVTRQRRSRVRLATRALPANACGARCAAPEPATVRVLRALDRAQRRLVCVRAARREPA